MFATTDNDAAKTLFAAVGVLIWWGVVIVLIAIFAFWSVVWIFRLFNLMRFRRDDGLGPKRAFEVVPKEPTNAAPETRGTTPKDAKP